MYVHVSSVLHSFWPEIELVLMKTVGHSYHGSKDQYGLSVCEVALAMIPLMVSRQHAILNGGTKEQIQCSASEMRICLHHY
jgi:hypothetical protein